MRNNIMLFHITICPCASPNGCITFLVHTFLIRGQSPATLMPMLGPGLRVLESPNIWFIKKFRRHVPRSLWYLLMNNNHNLVRKGPVFSISSVQVQDSDPFDCNYHEKGCKESHNVQVSVSVLEDTLRAFK